MSMDYQEIKARILEAALPHVAFDGWSETTFNAAVQEAGVEPALARAVMPRGAVDLALAYHARGDQQMVARLRETDLTNMRFREKVALAVRYRLDAVEDKEAVRRGMTLFALPIHAADGARAIWSTADLIWTTLGDSAEDLNWYTKRATLSGVISATLLYWLGDDSPNSEATWAFLDRRIENVMEFEKFKAQVNNNPLLKPLLAGPNWLSQQIRAPIQRPNVDWPGTTTDRP